MIGIRAPARVCWVLILVFCRGILRTASPVLVLFIFGLSGCGPGNSEQSEVPSFLKSDSTGILLSVTWGTSARAPLGWEIDSVPNLVIGAGDSESEYLYRVQGLRGRPDGEVLVVDGGSQELRFFDSQGRLLNRVGGKGEGPGEFRDPVLVPSPGTDSLLVFDKRLPRFQVFSSDGHDPRSIRHVKGWPNGRRPPLGAVSLKSLLWEGRSPVGGEESFRREGLRQLLSMFFWYDADTGEKVSIDSFVVDVAWGERVGQWVIPLTALPSSTITEGGAFITDGLNSEIREYDVEGRLRRIFRLDESGRPVTRKVIDSMIDLGTARTPRVPRRTRESVYAEMPIPDTMPVFQSLLVDEMGWLWAEVYEWDPARPKEWMVFDPEGRAHGVIQTPAGLQVEWIGRESILGVWKDELGVEYVHRHTLRRDTTVLEDSQGS